MLDHRVGDRDERRVARLRQPSAEQRLDPVESLLEWGAADQRLGQPAAQQAAGRDAVDCR